MSSPGIFLIQPNGELVEMNEQAYDGGVVKHLSSLANETVLSTFLEVIAWSIEEVKAAIGRQRSATTS